jgi:hypothetical protein
MRTFLAFLSVVVFIACIVFGYVLWRSFSGITGAENTLDGRLDALVAYYASMDVQYVTSLAAIPDLSPESASGIAEVHGALSVLVTPPASYDERMSVLMAAQKKIRQFMGSQGTSPTLASSPIFDTFSKESSNLGRASVVLKEFNEAVGAYNGRLLSRSGKIIGLWSERETKQFLNIDGTLSNDTVILFN